MVKQDKPKAPVPLSELKPVAFVKPLKDDSSEQSSEEIQKNIQKARKDLKKKAKKVSSSSSEEIQVKASKKSKTLEKQDIKKTEVTLKTDKKVTKAKIPDSDSSEDEKIVKKVLKPVVKGKKVLSSSESEEVKKPVVKGKKVVASSESEEVKPKKVLAKKGKADESDSEEIVKPSKGGKVVVNKKKVESSSSEGVKKPSKVVAKPVKKVESSSSEEPVKAKVVKKAKVSSSSSSAPKKPQKSAPKPVQKAKVSSSSSEPVKKPAVAQKKPLKAKVSSSSSEVKKPAKPVVEVKKTSKAKVESSSSSEVKKPSKPAVELKKTSKAKVESSSSSEVKKPVKATKGKKAASSSSSEPKKPVKSAKKGSSSYSSSSEVQLQQKRKTSTDAPVASKKVQLEPTLAKRTPEAPAPQKQANPGSETEVFIGGISYECTPDDLFKLFESCGEISNISVPTRGGQPGGIGFVTFTSIDSAQKACKLNGTQHMGRTVRINLSSQKPERGAGPGAGTKVEGGTVFVGNLSYETTEEGIYEFFTGIGNIKNIRLAKDPAGNPRGFAHVEFSSPDEAMEALKLTDGMLDGRAIRLDLAGGGRREGGGGGRGDTVQNGDFRVRANTGRPKENMKKSGALQEFQGKKVKL